MELNARMHHIGLIVDDLDQAVDFLTGTLGLGVNRTLDNSASTGAKAAFLNCGPVEIELIELIDDEQRQARLGDGPARVEHIAVEVDDIDAAFEELAAKGVEFTTPAPRQSGAFRTFTTTEATSDGLRYQFLQPHEPSSNGEQG